MARPTIRPLVATSDDYGVPIDGVTDATAAIRAALAGAAGTAAGPGKLGFRRVTYIISGNLDIPSYLDVDFNGATLKVADGTDKSVTAVRFMGTQRCGVRNVTLQCNRANRNPGSLPGSVADEYISGNGVTTRTDTNKTYAADIVLENVEVYDPPNHGFEIVGAERVRIVACRSEGAGDDCFSVGGKNAANNDLQPARMVALIGCIGRGSIGAYSSNSNGFECDDGSNHITIDGCISESNFTGGFQVHSHSDSAAPHDLTITGCIARNNPSQGIRVEGEGTAGLLQPYNIVVANNTISGPDADSGGAPMTYGIYVARLKDMTITGNVLRLDLINAQDDLQRVTISSNSCKKIFVAAGSDSITDVLVSDNLVNGSAAEGILIQQSSTFTVDRVTVRGNLITAPATSGIKLTDISGVTSRLTNTLIHGNRVSGHSQFGIDARGGSQTAISENEVVNTTGITTSNTECVIAAGLATITSNLLIGGRDGVRLNAGGDNSVVSGNNIVSPGNAGVNLVAVSSCTISGNRIVTAARGIDAATSGTDHVLTGNVISGMSGVSPNFAIRQQTGCDHWLIDGNNYRGIAISLAGANNVTGTNKT